MATKEINVGDMVVSIQEILKPIDAEIELIDKDILKLQQKREALQAKQGEVQREIGKLLGFSATSGGTKRKTTKASTSTLPPFKGTDAEITSAVKVLSKDDGKAGRGAIAEKLGVAPDKALSDALLRLSEAKSLKKQGDGRGTFYTVVG